LKTQALELLACIADWYSSSKAGLVTW